MDTSVLYFEHSDLGTHSVAFKTTIQLNAHGFLVVTTRNVECVIFQREIWDLSQQNLLEYQYNEEVMCLLESVRTTSNAKHLSNSRFDICNRDFWGHLGKSIAAQHNQTVTSVAEGSQ